MFFASVFYCINNDVFHETKFFNTKDEVYTWSKMNYARFLLNCQIDLDESLDANRIMSKMTYRDDHMFNFDYGPIKTTEPEIMDFLIDSDTEREYKKNHSMDFA